MMNRKSTVLIVLIAVLIALILHFLPSLIREAAVAYIKLSSPAKMVLVGDTIVCEELKARIQSQSVAEKEVSYRSVLPLVKLPVAEYADRVNRQGFIRQVLSVIESDGDIPLASGVNYSQKCLLEVLGMYKHHLDETVSALLKSDLVASAPNSQMQMQMATFFLTECQGQVACVQPLKEEIIRLHNFALSRQHISLLRSSGAPGMLAAFDIIDGMKDDELKKSGSDDTMTAQVLLSNFVYDAVLKEVAQGAIEKRMRDPAYSAVKKDLLSRSLPVPQMTPQTAGATQFAILQELLGKGAAILESYKKQSPQSTSEVEGWLREVNGFYGLSFDEKDSARFTQTIDGFVLWTTKAIGPEANIMQSLLNQASAKGRVRTVLPSTYELLKAPKTMMLGLRFLLAFDPISLSNQNLFLIKFADLPQSERGGAISLWSQHSAAFSGDFAFRLANEIGEADFQMHAGAFNAKKDDILLSWKRAEVGMKDPAKVAVWNWKIFVLTGDPDFGSKLKSHWIASPNCTAFRLTQIQYFLSSVRDVEKGRDLLEPLFGCAKNDFDSVTNVLRVYAYADEKSKKLLNQIILKSKSLTPALRAKLLKILEQENQRPTIVPNMPQPAFGEFVD